MSSTTPTSAAASSAGSEQGPWWPKPTGPHHVGTDEIVFSDQRYASPLAADANGRRLLARAWYPAMGPGVGRLLFEGEEFEAYAAEMMSIIGAPPALLQGLRGLRTHSTTRATPLEGRFPVVVFSHGGPSYLTQSTALLEELASHGSVVLSVAHPGLSAGVLMPDGETVAMDAEYAAAVHEALARLERLDIGTLPLPEKDRRIQELIQQLRLTGYLARFRDDAIALVDALTDGRLDGPDWLPAALDLERLAYVGMSFGGSASVSAGHADPRARAAVNLDGMHFSDDVHDQHIRLPLLEINSDPSLGPWPEFVINSFCYEPIALAGARNDILRLTLAGATHMDFTDALLLGDPRPLSPGTTPGRRVHHVLSTVLRRFLEATFNGGDYNDVLRDIPELARVDLAHIRAATRR